jgi:ABC transporter substrate binding protein
MRRVSVAQPAASETRRAARQHAMNEPVPQPEMVTDVAVLAALGLDHADDALGAVDVCNLEPNHLARAQAIHGENMWTPVGLMSYGINLQDQYRRAADYVHKILKGANPGELPIQLPTRFEFVISLKATKAIGHEIPAPILAQAAEVIE